MTIAFAITGTAPKETVQAPSLTEQLAAVGIKTLPLDQVRAHKRAVLKQERQGHEVLAFLLDVIDIVWRTLSLWYVVRIVEIGMGTKYHGTYALGLLFLSFGGIGLLAADQPMGWMLFVPPVMGVLAAVYVLSTEKSMIGKLRQRWMRTSIHGRGTIAELLGYVPEHLARRVYDAHRVPNVVIQLEEFGSDPFILVAPKWFGGPAVYIGAWDTGVDTFDNS